MMDDCIPGELSRQIDVDRRRFLQAVTGTAGSVIGTGTTSGTTGSTVGDSRQSGLNGDGSATTPYVVTDVDELQAIAQEPDAHYELGADIDASATREWNDGAGFEPVPEFTGSLDGRGHTIRGLRIDRPEQVNVGIFASLRGTVRNLDAVDVDGRGNRAVGGLAGLSIAATIENVEASGSVRGEGLVGGLVGDFVGATDKEVIAAVSDCRTDCRVEGGSFVGGLFGHLNGGFTGSVTVRNSVAKGPVTGKSSTGGLVGAAEDPFERNSVSIENCASHGSISARDDPDSYFGGLVGHLLNAAVTHARSTAAVDIPDGSQVGGLVGEVRNSTGTIESPNATIAFSNTTIEFSNAAGSVRGSQLVGGLVGASTHAYLRESCATGDVVGDAQVGGVVGDVVESDVVDVYAAGDVTGDRDVGGVLGNDRDKDGQSSLTRALVTGAIEGNDQTGAIVGRRTDCTVTDAYWDVETTGQTSSPGVPDGNGLSTAELRGQAAARTLDGFDFEDVWTTRENEYPTLRTAERQAGNAESDARIENLRLVQTVENSRVLAADAKGESHLQAAPVADDIVGDESSPDVDWTAPDPDFAAKRRVAPVFDLRVDEPGGLTEPVTLTGRLLRDGEVFREWTGTLAPDAVAGNDRNRSVRLNAVWGASVPDQLPLLETLARNSDAIGGEYPTFYAGIGSVLELEIDGPELAGPVTASHSIEQERVHGLPPLSVGIVGLEGLQIDTDPEYTFDDDVDLGAFADEVADDLLSTYPIRSVRTTVRRTPAYSDEVSTPHSAAARASKVMDSSLDDAHVVQHRVDDRREASVDAVDVTVGVVPGEFFDGRKAGAMPVVDGRPAAAAVLVELDHANAVAHELGHYFLGKHFTDPAVSMDGDPYHASRDLTSTGYAIQDGEFEVLPGRTSLMSYNTNQWIDAHSYQKLIESRFRPDRTPIREGVNSFLSDTLAITREQYQSLQAVPDGAVTGLTTSTDEVTARLERQLGTVEAAVASTDHYREVPDLPGAQFWEELGATTADLEAIGTELQQRDVRPVDDQGETTRTVGEKLAMESRELNTRAAEAASSTGDGGVDFALDIRGRIDGDSLDVDVDVVPTLGDPGEVDGAGTIEIRDGDADVLDSVSAATTTDLIAADGESTTTDSVLVGTARLPAEATTVDVEVPDERENTLTATVDPVTDPIERRVEALPDRAFVDATAREAVQESLDDIRDLVAAGDHQAANEELGTLRERLADGIRDGYAPRGNSPSKADVLSLVTVHETRTEPDESGQNWIVPGALGGLACGGLGLYLRRRWNGEE